MPSGPDRSRDFMSTMRFKLGFSLAMRKDGSHTGGRGVRKTRNEGERDSARATGDGRPAGVGASRMRGSISTASCIRGKWEMVECGARRQRQCFQDEGGGKLNF